jgi:hypothetical protein
MSRRKVPTVHGVLAESALVLLDQQRLVWPREEFAERYHGRLTIPDVLPEIAAAATHLTTVLRHLEERVG